MSVRNCSPTNLGARSRDTGLLLLSASMCRVAAFEPHRKPLQCRSLGEACSLPYYRLYHVRHGRFARTDELEADDDVTAVRQARELVEDGPAELRCGERKVTTFNSFEQPS